MKIIQDDSVHKGHAIVLSLTHSELREVMLSQKRIVYRVPPGWSLCEIVLELERGQPAETEQDSLIKETIEECAKLIEVGVEVWDGRLLDDYHRGRYDEAKENVASLRRVSNERH